MAAFQSEKHYSDFVEEIKSDADYQMMLKDMETDRLSVEAITLRSYNDNKTHRIKDTL